MIFALREVAFAYPGATGDAVVGVSMEVRAGELTTLVGPNGSGKTTLLRLMLGTLRPRDGDVLLEGRPAHAWSRRAFARTVGVVTQREEPAFPMRVREAVMHGRYARLRPLGGAGRADHAAVDQALERCDVAGLADRWVATLSGGEWQRVRVARALAQEPTVLVLDEPTANLDVRHEMDVFELTLRLVRDQGLGAVVVTHHVNLAARFADALGIMHAGRLRAIGTPRDVLTSAMVEDVFEWPMHIDDWRGAPQVTPLREGEDA